MMHHNVYAFMCECVCMCVCVCVCASQQKIKQKKLVQTSDYPDIQAFITSLNIRGGNWFDV